MGKGLAPATATFAILVLCGCAGGPPHHPVGPPIDTLQAFQCPAAGCDVYVSMRTDAQGVCRASVSDPIVAVGRGNRPVLTWRVNSLDGQQYQFKSGSGVFFKTSITADDFDSGHAVGIDRFSWRSVNHRAATFDYGVDVQRVLDHQGHTQDCLRLDPKIVNGGD